jgi:hypothetical protein
MGCSCRRCHLKDSLSRGVLTRNHCEGLDFALAPLFCQDAAWSKIIMSRFGLPSRQSYPGEGW